MVEMSVKEMKKQVREWIEEMNARSVALDIEDTIMCIDGVEVKIDGNDKICPVGYLATALIDDSTLVVPAFLDTVLDTKRRREPSYATWRRSSNIYTEMKNLRTLRFESGETELVPYAFMNCSNVVYADLSLHTYIPRGLFRNSKSLQVVDLRNAEIIEYNAFENCTNLKKIIISSKLQYVKASAFQDIPDDIEIEVVDELNRSLFVKQTGNAQFYKMIRKDRKPHKVVTYYRKR